MASEKLEKAKEAVQQSPAATLGYIKEYAASGAGVFKVIGGLDALYDIYNIYGEWKKKKENNDLQLWYVKSIYIYISVRKANKPIKLYLA